MRFIFSLLSKERREGDGRRELLKCQQQDRLVACRCTSIRERLLRLNGFVDSFFTGLDYCCLGTDVVPCVVLYTQKLSTMICMILSRCHLVSLRSLTLTHQISNKQTDNQPFTNLTSSTSPTWPPPIQNPITLKPPLSPPPSLTLRSITADAPQSSPPAYAPRDPTPESPATAASVARPASRRASTRSPTAKE